MKKPIRWGFISAAVLGFLLGTFLPQCCGMDNAPEASGIDWLYRQQITVVIENTKPTNDIVYVHLRGSGALCSADADTELIRRLRMYDNKTLVLKLEEPVGLQRIER